MSNSKLNNCNEILEYISYLKTRKAKRQDELSDLKFSFFNSKDRQRKKLIKAEIKKIDSLLEYYETFLEESTTFSKSDLVYFFTTYFSALYNKEYTAALDIKDKSEGRYWILTDFVVSCRDLRKIKKSFNLNKKIYLDDAIDMCQDTCLCFGGPSNYCLLEDTDLNEDINDFPELVEVIKLLVDIKLASPALNEKKRLALALKIMLSRLQKERNGEILKSSSKPIEPEAPIYYRAPQPARTETVIPPIIPPVSPVPPQPVNKYGVPINPVPTEPPKKPPVTNNTQQAEVKELVLRKSMMNMYTRRH